MLPRRSRRSRNSGRLESSQAESTPEGVSDCHRETEEGSSMESKNNRGYMQRRYIEYSDGTPPRCPSCNALT